MIEVLPYQIPWYVAGPAIGLLLVAMYAIGNQHLGISSSYLRVAQFVARRPTPDAWKVRYFAGLVVGALLAALLRGGPAPNLGYGRLSEALAALALPVAVLIPILFLAGLLMGYGARWADGCTSGHGISGSSALSPASLVATATFVATAIAVTMLLNVVTGGLL